MPVITVGCARRVWLSQFFMIDEASTPDPDDPNPEDDSWKNNDECYRWVVADDKGNILRFGYGSEGKKYDPPADHRKVGWFVALMKRHGLSGDITV